VSWEGSRFFASVCWVWAGSRGFIRWPLSESSWLFDYDIE
jgi:hypothetical protein